MISKKYVPINRSQMYLLLCELKTNHKLNFHQWRVKNEMGPKPLLSKKSMTNMIQYYNTTNEGGEFSSKLNLEKSITNRVKTNFLELEGYNNKKRL